MAYLLKSSKAWLSSEAVPKWVEHGHIQSAGEILQITVKGCGIEAYQIMFDRKYIRVSLENGHRLFFNFGGNLPNATQLAWLQKIALARHFILINGDSMAELDLESCEYREVGSAGSQSTSRHH